MSTPYSNVRGRLQPVIATLIFGTLAACLSFALWATRDKGQNVRAATVAHGDAAQQATADTDEPSMTSIAEAVEQDPAIGASEIEPPAQNSGSGKEDDPSEIPNGEKLPDASGKDAARQATTQQPEKPTAELTSAINSLRPVVKAATAVRPRARDESGIVFVGQSDQIALVKAQMRELLRQMGWAAEQVLVREREAGEQVAYVLNSAPGDTNTFVLAQRPQLGIASEIVHYTNRHGQAKTLALVSQKEILATMLQAGRASVFSGVNCAVDRLKEQIALRQNIVYWGMRTDWVFPEDKVYRYNTGDYWQVMKGDDWTLKPGIRASQAIADAFVGKFSYQIGCTSACRFIYVHGILDFFQQVRPNASVFARLEQLLDNQRPFTDIAPKVDKQTRIVLKEGRMMDRHYDVPWDNWVPGDWGWVKNPDEKSSEELGSEGCNIIYAGGGYFVNYYPERPPKTLDQGLKRVYGWRFGLEESELDLPEDLMQQLRQDPRSGGMLRDVRDFPKCFNIGSAAAQPGA